jgi:regulator of sigma E protease
VDLVYFILLISVLIFIHELGHFATAKLFGVKVLVFSLGFGPKLLRIHGGETEYCLGLLPFGGFVTMLEEARQAEPVPPEDRRRTFEAQRIWKRIVIVLAGPAMNLMFPVVLYTSVFLEDRELLPPTVGVVMPGKPADGQLMPGDRITAVEGVAVESFPEVQRIVAERAGRPTRVSIEREGKALSVMVTPSDEIADDDANELLGLTTHVGRVGVVPSFPSPAIGVPRPESPAYRAGLRTFDRITAVNGRPVDRMLDLVRALSQNRGDSVVLAFMRPVPQPRAMGGLCDIAVMEPGVATLTPASAGSEPPPTDASQRAKDVLTRTGIEPSDLYAAYVPEASSEWKAGLRAGDRVTTLDGAPKLSWADMQDDLKRGAGRMRKLEWMRDGEAMAGSFELRDEAWNDEFGQSYKKYVFRTTHWVPAAADTMVKNPHLYSYALRRGVEETGRAVQTVVVGLWRVAQGRVSLRAVSGPITIYDVAGQAGAKGSTYFMWAMALISVNLGLINLLPVPVLDGGHLAFFLAEAVRRKPASRRAREIASLLGMSVLVALMLVAFKNDVERHWGVIVGQWRELFRS